MMLAAEPLLGWGGAYNIFFDLLTGESTVMTISVAGADVYRTFVPDIERAVALFTLLPRRGLLGK
jgi:hypothetical protein